VDHRLSRRTLLLDAALVLAAAATASCTPANGANPTPSATAAPPDGAPVVSWTLTGGFTMAGVLALRPPRLVVYGDGETIADAAYRARLDDDELRTLVDHLVTALGSPDITKRRSAAPVIADAPTTVLKVWNGSTMLSVSAEGLDELRDTAGYPTALYDARDRLASVYKDVTVTAQPYLANRVRVVTEQAPADATGAGALQWPAEVTLPTQGDPTAADVHRADLDGQAARDAVRLLKRDLDQRGAWPTYRTVDGKLVQASWRYLLPDE
jgi:hypothetical protein